MVQVNLGRRLSEARRRALMGAAKCFRNVFNGDFKLNPLMVEDNTPGLSESKVIF
jgi:hypothetical protein